MTDNTPLNADSLTMANSPQLDDELEKNIFSIIEAHFKPSDNSLMPLNATKRVMQVALADRNKQIEEVLDRLEAEMKRFTAEHDIPMRDEALSAIEAERNRLKSGNERLRSLGITKEQIDSVEYFGDPPNKLKESK